MPGTQPNVIVLMTDDMGQHISPYGIDTVDSPNCERLAAEGVLFENAFGTAPQCRPSRASCFTGRFPHQNGVMGLTSSRTRKGTQRRGRRRLNGARPYGLRSVLECPRFLSHRVAGSSLRRAANSE